MEKVIAEALESNFRFSKGTEIRRIEKFQGILKIHVAGGTEELGCLVTFENPLGFRVVDERDMMEYWPVCSTPAGWLFRVLSGGWLDQERTRQGSLMLDTYPDMKEYLITGMHDCVSVFSTEIPNIKDSIVVV